MAEGGRRETETDDRETDNGRDRNRDRTERGRKAGTEYTNQETESEGQREAVDQNLGAPYLRSACSLPAMFGPPGSEFSWVESGAAGETEPVVQLPASTKDQSIYCELCDMWLNGPTQWMDHRIGKRHRRNTKHSGPHRGGAPQASDPRRTGAGGAPQAVGVRAEAAGVRAEAAAVATLAACATM